MRKRYVLLDRDGTIIVEKHFLSRPEDVELLPGSAEALRLLEKHGFGLIVTTNQSGVGRGLMTIGQLEAVHRRISQLAPCIRTFYYCPHTPSDGCACRKPAPELGRRAAAEFGFSLADAFVIGDKASDIAFGRACGAKTIQVMTGYGAREFTQTADWTADDLLAASRILIQQIVQS